MLKISEKLENINKNIEKLENKKNWYKIEIHEKYSVLKMSKNTVKTLNENGVKLKNNYISGKYKNVYNSIYTILKENSDIFTYIEEEENV